MLLKMIKSVSIFNRPPHTKSYGTILRSIGAGLQANSLDFDRDIVYYKQRRLIFCLHLEVVAHVVVPASVVALILSVVVSFVALILAGVPSHPKGYVIPQQRLP